MREQILVRAFEAIQGIPGIAHVARNNLDLPESRLPAVVVLDGNEEADDSAYGRGRPPNGPNLITMSPLVFIAAAAEPGEVGSALNTIRENILQVLRTDAPLLDLLHVKDVRYKGCQVALEGGRTTSGEMLLEFSLIYVQW